MKKRVAAAELMANLNANPEFVARQKRAEQDRKRREVELQLAEGPLVEELRNNGYILCSVWDLVNTTKPYSSALPILLEHLLRPYPSVVREGIARALAVPEAKFGWETLIQLYRNESEIRVKDGLAVALSAIADDSVLNDIISLVRDKRNGPSHLLLLRVFERFNIPHSITILKELRDDPELKKEIRDIMSRLKL